jgi:adenylyltransferase/sulfurtransferase
MRAVIIGVGGLGSPLALALALASRETRLVLVDDDVVDLSNLQRQILFGTADVGRPKVEVARAALARRGIDPARIEAVRARFDADSARALVHDADVVCDGSDNLETKFLTNDVCVALGRPFVIAGAIRHGGMVFPARPRAGDACYRCLFETPPDEEILGCAAAGILGATCGVVAAAQAEAALALARGDSAEIQVFEEDAVRAFTIRRRVDCAACGIASPQPEVSS